MHRRVRTALFDPAARAGTHGLILATRYSKEEAQKLYIKLVGKYGPLSGERTVYLVFVLSSFFVSFATATHYNCDIFTFNPDTE